MTDPPHHDPDLHLDPRHGAGERCPYCHDALGDPAKGHWTCASCHAAHHSSCWAEAGGRCVACGSVQGRTSGGPTARPSETDLLEILAHEGHVGVVAALRASGLSEPEALEEAVSFAARLQAGPQRSPGSPLGWVLAAEAAALGGCAVLAALTEAQAAVIGGALALAAPLPFLFWAAWREEALGVGVGVTVLNVLMGAAGAGLVDGLDIRRRHPSGVLFLAAVVFAGVIGVLALWRWTPPRSSR